MRRWKQIWIVLVVVSGLWGCARGPANQQSTAEKLKALESKLSKIEDDFRVSVAAREQLRKKLTTNEEEKTKLQQQVDQLLLVTKERDSLKQEVSLRTTERDQAQVKFDQLRNGIRSLIGPTEGSSPAAAVPVPNTTASATSSDGKS